MIRTQISLTDEQKRRLDEESAKTGLSMSELIRRLIDEHYRTQQRDAESWREAIDAAAGAWKDRDFHGEEYVERLRTGRRLRELFG
jgi:Ribbon-helix-helix protein, copG family